MRLRTLEDALVGADVVFGLSVKGAFTADMIRSMAPKPIIFAMANPDPEITPEEVAEIREDAIMATGRSDYPNQVNNVLGFPYIFRGALDVRAKTINNPMKIAAAQALAELARQDVPDEVAVAYHGQRPQYGPKYIIPVPFDPRLISHIPTAVAKAAMDTGVAGRPIVDMLHYQQELSARLDPTAGLVQTVTNSVRSSPRRVVFAEGEEEAVIRAAVNFKNQSLGTPVLIGREEEIRERIKQIGLEGAEDLEIHNARVSDKNPEFSEFVFDRLQRKGALMRDAIRMVNTDRNIFGACMVALGHADAMVTGVTRNYSQALGDIKTIIDPREGQTIVGTSIILAPGRTIFVSDTNVNEMPSAQELAEIAIQTAKVARRVGFEPRVAFLAYSTFGNPPGERSELQRAAVSILDQMTVDFEYEGEMAADVALNPDFQQYPFSRLKGPANCMIMPAIHSANIATKLLQELGRCTVIGPLVSGLAKPVQICRLGAPVSDIVSMAAFAAYDLSEEHGLFSRMKF